MCALVRPVLVEGPGRAESKDKNSLHDVDVSGVESYSGSFSSVVAAGVQEKLVNRR